MSVTKVILPKLGLTMDEGKIVAWRKREGDAVAAGEILFEVETDKATMEVEAPAAGVVRKIFLTEGAMAPVTTLIAVIADSASEPLGDVASESVAPGANASSLTAAPSAPASVPSPAAAEGERVRSSPAARKRAQELGIDIEKVRGTGPGGRVTLEDVDAASARPPAAAPVAAPSAGGAERRIALTRMRRAIADAMTRSAQVPQFQVSRDVDMTAADELRRSEGVSFTDLLVAACARALRMHERFRGRFDGDAIVVGDGVHVGVALALADGLIVPVIRDADRKDLKAIAQERERLQQGARAGKLPADALTGAVFSISNLGTLGVDRFQALVNPPEAAILAVGRLSRAKVLTLTLSVDHRVADGADAARFLSDVAAWLESGGRSAGG
ncbi:MAG: 2-oxo acid dehydrogenase subunit E2 [Chloroflexota bacterium]|nr:2-oxo acid dehydrogenase subunit E2 [Chloroflexota bacterium]